MKGAVFTLLCAVALVSGKAMRSEDDDLPVGNNHDDPSQAPAICRALESDSILVAHEYCNQFYKCTHGLPVALKCPGVLLFSPKTDRCEWPGTVECGNRIIPDVIDEGGSEWIPNEGAGNSDPSQAPAICAAEESDNIMVAHENCNRYYQCWGGFPVPMDCPPNLLFNPAHDFCDWPANVNCGNRYIPDNK